MVFAMEDFRPASATRRLSVFFDLGGLSINAIVF